jgi:Protein of unknown function (DUF3187)
LRVHDARAEEFFPVRDQNPLLRGFYLPLPSDSRANAAMTLSATLLVSNTLNVDHDPHENLLVDGESDVLNLTYENALAPNWRYRITLPLIHDSGGIFDSVIDSWHRLFGLPRGNRPYYPKNEITYSYSGQGSIDIRHAQTGIGDIDGELGWFALDDAHRTLSVWGGLEAPTGSASKLTGDGAWDGAVWAHGALRFTHWQLAAEAGVSQPFGDEIFAGNAHRTSAFGRLAATRSLGSVWSVRAQLEAQTAHLAGSDDRFLGPSLEFGLGMVRRLRGHWHVEMGFVEDAAVNTAPDITFFVGVRN